MLHISYASYIMNTYIIDLPAGECPRSINRSDCVFCRTCGAKLNDDALFCTSCGERMPAAQNASSGQPDPTKPAARTIEYDAPTKEYVIPTKEYVREKTTDNPVLTDELPSEDPTVLADNFDVYPSREVYAEQLYSRDPYGGDQAARPQAKKPLDYRDSFTMEEKPRFDDSGWEDHRRSRRKPYQPTSAGMKFLSFLLCLLMLFFGFCAMLIGASRIAFSEKNVRKAYQKGSLADLKITTDDGEKSIAELFTEGIVDADTYQAIPLTDHAAESFFEGSEINTFAENLAVDFTGFFIFGKTPSLLNADAITSFLSSAETNIGGQITYRMSGDEIDIIGQRINGGDLSFLSIDSDGGYFKQKYGMDPNMISRMFSPTSLAVCTGIVLLCMILNFIIHRRDPAFGFGSNGATMILFGVLNTFIAAGLLILSFLKNIFLLSELLRGFTFAMGGVSLSVLVIGIIFAVLKTVFRNRI